MPERLRGHIKWFSHQKRYGCIERGPGLADVFLQAEDLPDIEGIHELEDGTLVEFSVEHTPAGPMAANIVMLSMES
jgi:cold shock CspA family protein